MKRRSVTVEFRRALPLFSVVEYSGYQLAHRLFISIISKLQKGYNFYIIPLSGVTATGVGLTEINYRSWATYYHLQYLLRAFRQAVTIFTHK